MHTMEEIEDFGFDHPGNTIISGTTGSGKSQIMGKVLASADKLFTPAPTQRILFYREDQPMYNKWIEEGILTEKCLGVPDREDFLRQLAEHRDKGGSLIFFDDFSSLIEENKNDFVYYFTIASHHYKASMFLIIHSLFSPALRLLSLNTHRFILTKSPRDMGQVRILGSQAFPGRSAYVVDSFEDATSEKFGFLVLDFSPHCDKRLRILGDIFTSDGVISVYEYKAVGRAKTSKMEKNFRKQALIPWQEYLRLKEKANPVNNVGTNSPSCRQNISGKTSLHLHQNPHPPVYHPCSFTGSTLHSNTGQYIAGQSKKTVSEGGEGGEGEVQVGADTLPEALKTQLPHDQSHLLQTQPSINPHPTTNTEVTNGGAIPRTLAKNNPRKTGGSRKKALKKESLPFIAPPLQITNPQLYLDPPYPPPTTGAPLALTHTSAYPSSTSILSPSHPNQLMLPTPVSLTNAPTPPSDALVVREKDGTVDSFVPNPSTSLLPQLALSPHERASIQVPVPIMSLPVPEKPAAIDYSPVEDRQHLSATRKPLAIDYTPAKGSKGKIKNSKLESKKASVRTPQRALENMQTMPTDSSYPRDLVYDPDVGRNPSTFPPGIRRKKTKTLNRVKGSIFRPSPPISNMQGRRANTLGKRKNKHLSRPRPSLPKYRKINQGDKRKNVVETAADKKRSRQGLVETDYDIWDT